MNKRKNLGKKNVFVCVLKVKDENNRIWIRIGQRHGSADPDPYQNFTTTQVFRHHAACSCLCAPVGINPADVVSSTPAPFPRISEDSSTIFTGSEKG
jgi:hypothetical protein